MSNLAQLDEQAQDYANMESIALKYVAMLEKYLREWSATVPVASHCLFGMRATSMFLEETKDAGLEDKGYESNVFVGKAFADSIS